MTSCSKYTHTIRIVILAIADNNAFIKLKRKILYYFNLLYELIFHIVSQIVNSPNYSFIWEWNLGLFLAAGLPSISKHQAPDERCRVYFCYSITSEGILITFGEHLYLAFQENNCLADRLLQMRGGGRKGNHFAKYWHPGLHISYTVLPWKLYFCEVI